MVQVQPLIPYSKYLVLCLRLVDAPRDHVVTQPTCKETNSFPSKYNKQQ
jgi:hypothetical protein